MVKRKLKAGVSEFEQSRKAGIFQELEEIARAKPKQAAIRRLTSRNLFADEAPAMPASPPTVESTPTTPTATEGMGRRRSRKSKKAGRRRATRRRR